MRRSASRSGTCRTLSAAADADADAAAVAVGEDETENPAWPPAVTF